MTRTLAYLNVPSVGDKSAAAAIVGALQRIAGAHAGSWIFTLGYVAIWWAILDFAYRKRIFWKL